MKNPQIVVHGLDRILAWEAWLTSLFSRVCLEPVVGLFESKEHRYIPARRTIFLQAGNGDVVSVHDSTWDSGSCYQFYSMVIELGHLLLEESLPLKLVQGFDRVSPLYERSMTLYGKDTGNVVARFQIAHYAEQPPISELPDVSFIHRRAAVLPVQLVLGGCLLRQPVGAVEVGTFLPLRELRLTGLRNFVTRPMLERGKLFLKVEELVMEGDSDELDQDQRETPIDAQHPVPMVVKLGAIELPLADLLSLRPGMVIEFPRPVTLQGGLEVAGGDWAEVEIEVEKGLILLRVVDIRS